MQIVKSKASFNGIELFRGTRNFQRDALELYHFQSDALKALQDCTL